MTHADLPPSWMDMLLLAAVGATTTWAVLRPRGRTSIVLFVVSLLAAARFILLNH